MHSKVTHLYLLSLAIFGTQVTNCISNFSVTQDAPVLQPCVSSLIKMYLNNRHLVIDQECCLFDVGDAIYTESDSTISHVRTSSHRSNSLYVFCIEENAAGISFKEMVEDVLPSSSVMVICVNCSERFRNIVVQVGANRKLSNLFIAVIYDNADVALFRWNPFGKDIHCGRNIDISLLNYCKNRNFSKPSNSLLTKKINAYQQCNLKISWVSADGLIKDFNSGLLPELFKNVGKLADVNVFYNQKNNTFENEMLTNGTTFLITDVLHRGEADVSFGRLIISDDKLLDSVEFGPVLFADVYCLVARKPTFMPIYRCVFKLNKRALVRHCFSVYCYCDNLISHVELPRTCKWNFNDSSCYDNGEQHQQRSRPQSQKHKPKAFARVFLTFCDDLDWRLFE